MTIHITCDDCGFSEAINHAALAVAADFPRHPVSASVIANFPATQHALDLFRGTRVRVGAHLNLTEGVALTGPHPRYTDEAGRLGLLAQIQLWQRASRADFLRWAEDEFEAQIATIAAGTECLEHLTTHMHFQLVPVLNDLLGRLARRWRVAWVRTSRLTGTLIPGNPLVRPPVDSRIWLNAREQAQQVPAMDYLAAVISWIGVPAADLRGRLPRDGRVELVVHPGVDPDPGFPHGVGYGPAARASEVRYLHAVLE